MPFTFSHPAIIVPFCNRKWRLSSTALIIGSIVPDYEFILQLREVRHLGHQPLGVLFIDIPLAYLFCFIFHNVLRNSTINSLPAFLYNKFAQTLDFDWNAYAKDNKFIVFVSILIGIFSHLFLDSFTHKNGFAVTHLAVLQQHIFVAGKHLSIYFLLQLFFSFFGLLVGIVAILKLPNNPLSSSIEHKLNYKYWFSLVGLAVLILAFRIYLLPNSNNFWSVIIAIVGAFHYAWVAITFVSRNSKVLLTRAVFVFFLLPSAELFAQDNNQLQRNTCIEKANDFRKQENYIMAIQQLDTILLNNPKDAGILLFKGDLQLQAKQFKNAVATYKSLLPLNFETTITKINLSYALFMNHKTSQALVYAKDAYINDTSNTSAIMNYFNALLWNLKTKEAGRFLAQQQTKLAEKDFLVLKARLLTTSGDFTNGLKYYDSLITKYVDKNYINENAEVLLGKKQWSKSLALMKKNDTLFSANEYNNFLGKAAGYKQQNLGTEMVYFRDVGKNTRVENYIWWQQKEAKDFRFLVKAGTATVRSAANEKTNVYNATLHIDEFSNRKLSGQTDLNIQEIIVTDGDKFSALTGKQLIKYQPNDRKMLSVFYSTDILNFTAALLGNNIRSHNLGYATHILLSSKTGFYSEGSAGALTDLNRRSQIFVSLYRLLRTEPTVKTGLNFSGLHFSDNSITKYFSPNSFLSTEAFIDYATPVKSKFLFQSQLATGLQKIEKQNWQSSFRFQAEAGYQKKHYAILLKYQTSNIAAASGTGYSFDWFTGKFIWKW